MEYLIRQSETPPRIDAPWNDATWQGVPAAKVQNFLPESSDHRPVTLARVVYDDTSLYGMFRVVDRYVRCVHTNFQDSVCHDSCVEFFFKPSEETGYFNFEFSGGGAMLVYYIEDHTRTENGYAKSVPLTADDVADVRIHHSLPAVVDPEIEDPITWSLAFSIPISLVETYTGALGALEGQVWTGNFYKCGDKTSHPHWATWSPVDEKNFHLPHCFGPLRFES